ncbi:MAG: (1-_4)-alpha-D-glucan 1-alpha-D-glucosylmutase, partial [Actinomycetota bacterium]|nr:(1->4)-alpha-D-glucan 1-alpha-D-glucosylmutase [Actinomycetota bacterium]
ATIAAFPVYRTYVEGNGKGATEDDRRLIETAVHQARIDRPDLDPDLFELLHGVLVGNVEGRPGSELLLRFQQVTGPVMAKGMEDTVFYNFNRFVALNEVGGDPSRFGAPPSEFHDRCAERARSWPRSMLATSTHDTKRSDDARARLCVLSEVPERWADAVYRWTEITDAYRRDSRPDNNAVYLFFQSLVAAWPLSTERAVAYMEKATKEAKAFTSWIDPDPDYDSTLRAFVEACLGDPRLVQEVETFVDEIADAGYVNSLAQTLVKLTAPGVPDIYQGSESWDFSLVDPDNRRPVDYAARRDLLDRVESITGAEAWAARASGAPKMLVTSRALQLINEHPDLFATGGYEPIAVAGDVAEHVVAYARGGRVACVVPRLWMSGRDRFDQILLQLPEGRWRNAFDDAVVWHSISIAELWRDFPVALLVREQ